MNSRHIIAEAWHFTRENKKLMWWFAFIPSVLTTLVGVFYFIYQYFSFKRSPLFDNAPQSFLSEVISTAFGFLSEHGSLWLPTIIIVVVVVVLYLLLPTLMQASLIQVIAHKRKGHPISMAEGFSLGILAFLPFFEYSLLIKSFSVVSMFTEAGFAARNLGTGAMNFLLPIFILAAIIGLVLTLLFTYSEFFIVLEKKSVLRAMGRSAKLVILSWKHTFLIVILMAIIGLRIIINILAVLLVPALIFLAAGLLATLALAKIGILIGVIFGLVGLFVASYFTGILHVFAAAVWTFTFLELMEEPRTQEAMGK
ncbi:MAG: hypothetical protein AAB606_00410 [Patescibacteria group bacterium]